MREEFKATLPPKYLRIVYPEKVFMPYLERKYDNDIQKLNAAWGTNYKSFGEVYLPHTPPQNPEIYKVWREFLRDAWPLRFIKLTGGDELYREFLKEKYGTVEAYNAHFRGKKQISSFDEITLPKTFPEDDLEFQDWAEFVDNKLPGKYIRIVSAMSYQEVRPPFREYDYIDFITHKRDWKLHFLKSNYTKVMRFLVLRGRALYVTFLFVTGAILTQLTVMPLAAFALSRFKLPYTHRILLFLLATMAFPAEVSMIPNFLLMKELHLLNTLWALVLPGMANGFGIFLLKGFFDSLPAELYEAAYIEGASELQMFWHITIPMAKPILAVIALGAFTGAYGSFMWALIICQNPKWWTLMVWLYQFQHYNPPYIVMASLVVAAIPTLLVFIFCQNIILRGIIIPTFK